MFSAYFYSNRKRRKSKDVFSEKKKMTKFKFFLLRIRIRMFVSASEPVLIFSWRALCFVVFFCSPGTHTHTECVSTYADTI